MKGYTHFYEGKHKSRSGHIDKGLNYEKYASINLIVLFNNFNNMNP